MSPHLGGPNLNLKKMIMCTHASGIALFHSQVVVRVVVQIIVRLVVFVCAPVKKIKFLTYPLICYGFLLYFLL